jgi:hypothetical protein
MPAALAPTAGRAGGAEGGANFARSSIAALISASSSAERGLLEDFDAAF